MEKKRDLKIFTSAFFFVLGFSLVFSILGVLLQTILSDVSFSAKIWLGRVGGIVIIFFGLFLLGLIRFDFLQKEYKFSTNRKFSSHYIGSFVFGAAFAVGWTPCVGAALGSILALAASNSSSAFILLLAYSLGLGIPFLIVGWFTSEAKVFISRHYRKIHYLQYLFGAILVLVGILIFVGQLGRIANIEFIINLISNAPFFNIGSGISSLTLINIGISLFAGVVSFLSPCILPIIPGFLSYLASIDSDEITNKK